MNRRAFASEEEPALVDALRAGGYILVSLVALVGQASTPAASLQTRHSFDDGTIVGHILFSELPIETGTTTITAAALAPMAVLPEYQRRGIGGALITRGLDLCRDRGCAAVVVVGHPEYYPRFGFSAELATRLRAPFTGPAFMAIELIPGAIQGVEGTPRYAPPFGI